MCVQKIAVSVSEMARMVGLSRSRFYQLIGSAFPTPLYDVATKRPFYPADLQEVCMDVRRRNCGVDGKPILFHLRGREVMPNVPKPPRGKATPGDDRCRDLVTGLKSLGMATATAAQVEAAMKEIHLSTVEEHGDGEVLKAVFLHLKRRDISAPMESEEK